MAWIEEIQTQFRVTTGDGRKFLPEWLITSTNKKVQYNTTEFLFVNVKGSLVKRKQPRGARYNIEVIFIGPECIATGKAFEKSAENPKPWTIEHPIHGQLLVTPLDLDIDNSMLNTCKINCNVIETIGAAAFNKPDAGQIVAQRKSLADISLNDAVLANVHEFSFSDLQTISENATRSFNACKSYVLDNQDLANFTNAYYQLVGLTNAGTTAVLSVVAQTQIFLNLPFTFTNPVSGRIAMLQLQVNKLNEMLLNPLDANKKRIFEHQLGLSIGAMCITSVTNYNYPTRQSVVNVVDIISSVYNDFVTNLDLLSSENYGKVGNYIADADGMVSLSNLVNYTIAQLYGIAVDAKQERSMILPNDINPVKLAHQLYGLTADDSTITQLLETNNIGRTEIICLKKGRKIIYYI